MSEVKTIAEVIETTKARFDEIAPQNINYASEKGFAIQILNNNDYLMKVARECPSSLQQALANVAAIGLSINPAEKLAYLIPRSIQVSKGVYQTRIFLEPSYMGLCKLATDSGAIKWIQANIVYENDEFIDNGPGKEPTHKYKAFSERGQFVGCYCVAKTNDGDYLTTIMTAAEIYSIRDRSEQWKKSQSGPWKTDFNEQAKKTVVRRGFKMWPKSSSNRMDLAVDLSNQNEGFTSIVTAPTLKQFNGEQKTFFDQLIESGNAIGMYVFLQTIDDSIATSLYNSFEKGTVTKYKRVVDELSQKGADQFTACMDAIEQAFKENDAFAASEIFDGLSQDAINLIKDRVSNECAMFIKDVFKQREAA